MTTPRWISSWLPLLQRPFTRSCPRAATRRLLHPPEPAAALTAARRGSSALQSRAFGLSACRLKGTDDFCSSGYTQEEEEEEDYLKDSEVEELFQQQVPTGIGEGHHRVFIVHPDVKWGSRKQHLTTGSYSSVLK